MTSIGQSAPATTLEWDSEFWRLKIARADAASVLRPDELLRWLDGNDIDCAYLRLPAEERDAVWAAQGCGFRVVELRVDYGRTGSTEDEEDLPIVRPPVAGDLSAITDIARGAHTDTRFFADPHFDDERCAEMYATWIQRSVTGELGGWVLVADIEGAVSGYAAAHVETPSVGRIQLIAVAPERRGRGLGTRLVEAAAARFAAAGVPTVRVATQASNLAANRLYQRAGFVSHAVSYDLHWWRDGRRR